MFDQQVHAARPDVTALMHSTTALQASNKYRPACELTMLSAQHNHTYQLPHAQYRCTVTNSPLVACGGS